MPITASASHCALMRAAAFTIRAVSSLASRHGRPIQPVKASSPDARPSWIYAIYSAASFGAAGQPKSSNVRVFFAS
jgi:hypothetical protein